MSIINTIISTINTSGLIYCSWISEKINFLINIIADSFRERIQIIRLFELSSLEFEKQETLDAIKKGNFLTFLLFILVLVLLIIIDKKYGFQSRRNKNKKQIILKNSLISNGSGGSSNSNNSYHARNRYGNKHHNNRSLRRSIGSSTEMKLQIPDIEHLQNKRKQRDDLHTQHVVHENKLKSSQSSISLSSLENDKILLLHPPPSPSSSSFSPSSLQKQKQKKKSTYSPPSPLSTELSLRGVKDSNSSINTLDDSSDGNNSLTSSLSSSDNSNNRQQNSNYMDEFHIEEQRKLLNQSIREKSKDKQRSTILNSLLLEDLQKNKKASLPPQFKRIRSSKKNSYSYQSSSLFNSSTITHSKLINGVTPPITTSTNTNTPVVSQTLSSFNNFNNHHQNLLPFFNAKIDTTNYISTQTFGYNYKGANQNLIPTTTTNTTNNTTNNNHQEPSSPNHHLVEIVEFKIPSITTTNIDNKINNSASNSSQMLLSVDQFLEIKTKEQEIINNTVVINSSNDNISSSKNKNSLVPQNNSLGFKNIRISDHGEKVVNLLLPKNNNNKLKSPKKRSKLLMSNYNEEGLDQLNNNKTNISLRSANSGIKVESESEKEESEYYDENGDDEKETESESESEEEQHQKIDQLYKEKSSSSEQLNKLISPEDCKTTNTPITVGEVITTTTATATTTTIPQPPSLFDTINNSTNSAIIENEILQEEEEDYCDSDIDGEDFSSVNIDYNERFQEIMEDLRNIDCNSLQSDKIKVNSQFIALTQDFVYASSTFGKVIISERYLPNSEKTIPSIDIGGLAGGDKFVVHGILFKFAIDREDFYGSDYAAMCVGGHELKGLINVFNCNVSHLSLPLMALVDYRGFRVIAMSILPVEKDSIYYGSNDYGLTIHNNDEYLSTKVKEVATLLNIKSHRCGEQATFLHSPADLEGHRGFDGRYYLLDFARLYAPEAPRKDIKMSHLYRLLRPEFVRNYKKPLCSDSFSRFIRGHNETEHNSEALEATSYLLNTTIPELVEELNGVDLSTSNVYTFPITEYLHRSGLNVRYLGHVRQLCKSLDMKSLIFIEMCARVVKQQLRQKLRFKMKQAKIPLEAPYRRLIVAYLNRILGISDKSDAFWNSQMKKYLIKKFDKGLFEDEILGNSLILGLSSFSDHLIDGKYLLFKRIQKMTGLKFTHRINEEFRSQPNCWLFRGENPLDINDLDEIGIRVKYVPFMNVAQGYLFKVKGEMLFNSGDPIAANRFFKMALEKLETALETDPNNADTLCTVGEVYSHLGVGDMQGVSEIQFSDRNNPDINKAFEYFQRAIFSNPNHTDSLFRFAQLLERCGEYDSAEDYYLSSLITNPNNIVCLQEYGNFLQSARNDFATAEQFFMRGSTNHQYLHTLKLNQPNSVNIRSSSGLLKVKSSSSGSNTSSNNFFNSHNSNGGSSNGNIINNNNNHNNNNNNNNKNNNNNNNINNNNSNNSGNSSGSNSGNSYDYSSSNSSTTSSNNSTTSSNINGSPSSSSTSSPSTIAFNNICTNNNMRGSGNSVFNNNELRGSGGCIRLTPPFLGLSQGIDLTPIRENNIRKSNSSTPNISPRGRSNSLNSVNSFNSVGSGGNNSNNNSDVELSSSPLQRKFIIN